MKRHETSLLFDHKGQQVTAATKDEIRVFMPPLCTKYI